MTNTLIACVGILLLTGSPAFIKTKAYQECECIPAIHQSLAKISKQRVGIHNVMQSNAKIIAAQRQSRDSLLFLMREKSRH